MLHTAALQSITIGMTVADRDKLCNGQMITELSFEPDTIPPSERVAMQRTAPV